MAWRLARSLERLRDQVNAAYPNRDRASDGTIGDASHSSTVSDHNPDNQGVVAALDLTHDPANGADMDRIAESLRESGDSRIKYVIFNGRAFDPYNGYGWDWQPYNGSNRHTSHMHVSVANDYDNARDWNLMSNEINQPLGEDMSRITDLENDLKYTQTIVEELKGDLTYTQKQRDGFQGDLEAEQRASAKLREDIVKLNGDHTLELVKLTNQIKELQSVVDSMKPGTQPVIDKNAPGGKGFRTFIQSLVGLYGLLAPLLLLPEVQALFTTRPGWALLPVVGAALTAVVTYLQNKVEDNAESK